MERCHKWLRWPRRTAGFQFDPENPAHRESDNASRYTVYHLPYTPQVTGEGALRPEIKIETAIWPLPFRRTERDFFLGGSI